jgi:hypothetical protein
MINRVATAAYCALGRPLESGRLGQAELSDLGEATL